MISFAEADKIHKELTLARQDALSNLFNQQQQMSQGLSGLLGQAGMAQGLMGGNQLGSNQYYTGQGLQVGQILKPQKSPRIQPTSIPGWNYDYDKGGYVDKDNHFISKREIEDGIPLELAIKKATMPNIAWLDERIEEMRIKL
jgi:hypothetical protein